MVDLIGRNSFIKVVYRGGIVVVAAANGKLYVSESRKTSIGCPRLTVNEKFPHVIIRAMQM